MLQGHVRGPRPRALRVHRSAAHDVPAPHQQSLVLVHRRMLGPGRRVLHLGPKVVFLRGRRVFRPGPVRGRLLPVHIRKRLLTMTRVTAAAVAAAVQRTAGTEE